MAKAVSFKFAAGEQAKFGQLLSELESAEGFSAERAIVWAGRKFVRSLVAKTPKSNGKVAWVEVSTLPPEVRADFVSAGIISSGQRWVKAKAIGWMDYKVRGRGFAKSGWVKAISKLGGPKVAGVGKGSYDASDFIDRRKASNPFVEMADSVPYIVQLDDGTNPNNVPFSPTGAAKILDTAMIKTNKQLEWFLTKVSREEARKWG